MIGSNDLSHQQLQLCRALKVHEIAWEDIDRALEALPGEREESGGRSRDRGESPFSRMSIELVRWFVFN